MCFFARFCKVTNTWKWLISVPCKRPRESRLIVKGVVVRDGKVIKTDWVIDIWEFPTYSHHEFLRRCGGNRRRGHGTLVSCHAILREERRVSHSVWRGNENTVGPCSFPLKVPWLLGFSRVLNQRCLCDNVDVLAGGSQNTLPCVSRANACTASSWPRPPLSPPLPLFS
jgi:hypothetical protein